MGGRTVDARGRDEKDNSGPPRVEVILILEVNKRTPSPHGPSSLKRSRGRRSRQDVRKQGGVGTRKGSVR